MDGTDEYKGNGESRYDYCGEEQSHELRKKQKFEIQTILHFDRIGDGHGLVFIILEFQTEEIDLHLEEMIEENQYDDPR